MNLQFLVKPLKSLFELINSGITSIIPNLSVAYFFDILIFTLILKAIMIPLQIKQTKSMVKMGEISPKMKEFQEKYKNDPKKLQEKQLEIYKEAGVNPFSGCLPILIQFPIFMAMYAVIYNFKGFAGVPFLWVPNLGVQDKTFILPILSGLTTYISSKILQPNTNDAAASTQKSMNVFMSIFIVWMSYKVKSGLVLYWIISNILQLVQQYFIVNKIRDKEQSKLSDKVV